MSKLTPLGENILCEPVADVFSDDGIKSSDTEKEEKKLRSEKGRILALGTEYEGELKEGDFVYFQKFGVEWIDIDGKEYVVGPKEHFFVKINE